MKSAAITFGSGRHSKQFRLALWQVFPLIFTSIFLLHAPLLRLPYFWDELGYYIPAAYDFFSSGSLIPHSTLSTHPPLMSICLALWWKFNTYTPAATRTGMLLVSAVALLAVFVLARRVANTTVATASVVLTALFPVFFAQSSLAHADMLAAAFTLWGIAFYFDPTQPHRRTVAILFFSLAVLSKETAIITPLSLAVYEAWQRWRGSSSNGRDQQAYLALLSPSIPLIAWYVYHYMKTGYVLGNPVFVRYNLGDTLNPLRFLLALLERVWHLFGYMHMIVLTAATALAMGLTPQQHASGERPRIALETQYRLLAIIIGHLLLFSIAGGALLTRYLLPVYPLVILVGVSTIWRRVLRWPLVLAVVAMAFAAALLTNPPYRFAPEDNIVYSHYVRVHKQACDYLSAHYPHGRVLTAWTASDELTKPFLGYVRQPIAVVRIENFSIEQLELARQAAQQYNVALLFATKYEPAHPLLPRWTILEKLNSRFFGYHYDLPPDAAAQFLNGRLVWKRSDGPFWASVIDFERSELASNSASNY